MFSAERDTYGVHGAPLDQTSPDFCGLY